MRSRELIVCGEWAIGVSVAKLFRLDYLNIPMPFKSNFSPYGVYNRAGNMLSVGDAFPSCTWEWNASLERTALTRLLAFISGAGGFVYIRTTKNHNDDWGNFYCALDAPQTFDMVGDRVSAFANPKVTFSALIEQ